VIKVKNGRKFNSSSLRVSSVAFTSQPSVKRRNVSCHFSRQQLAHINFSDANPSSAKQYACMLPLLRLRPFLTSLPMLDWNLPRKTLQSISKPCGRQEFSSGGRDESFADFSSNIYIDESQNWSCIGGGGRPHFPGGIGIYGTLLSSYNAVGESYITIGLA